MPKVSQEYQETRRKQIIEAAVRCISRKGFHQASMQDIVAESGLSSGAIYLYFKSKEEIIKTIADMRHAREKKVIAEAFASGDSKIALNKLVESFFDALADRKVRVERSIEVQLWGEALCNPRVREIARQGLEETRAAFVEALTEYQKRGMLSPGLSVDAMARAMIAQFHGFVLQIALDDNLDIKEYVKVIKSWIGGLEAGNDPSGGTGT
jgi:AcrR family transcriptional regulator